MTKTLLVIDDDTLLCETINRSIARSDLKILTAHKGNQGIQICKNERVDAVLLDQKLPDSNGVDLCQTIMKVNDHTKIIFITAYPSFSNAVQAIKAGAYDYLSKPFEIDALDLALSKALRTLDLERFERVNQYQYRVESRRTNLIGSSSGLRKVQGLIELAALNRAPVLITGETGTGKNLVAKAIHYSSHNPKSAFIDINCAALAENLIEAELFGYEKGAFTGAVTANKGIFEMAENGTLFLDEIGEIPKHLQSKLLGILDDKKIRRIGSQTFKPVNVRIIAATNTDLEQSIQKKQFRQDLYYRLSVLRIHIPPLRHRIEDLPHLSHHFINQITKGKSLFIPAKEIQAMSVYPWPGNVRELRNIIERAILLRESNEIRPSRLLEPVIQFPVTDTFNKKIEKANVSLKEMENAHIQKTLVHMGHNYTQTAHALGISRSTLMRKLKNI
jgi:DNA-binding NtrC family response regulator